MKRGRGEYIRTPPVTAFGGDSPLINAGAKGGVAANSTINCNFLFFQQLLLLVLKGIQLVIPAPLLQQLLVGPLLHDLPLA